MKKKGALGKRLGCTARGLSSSLGRACIHAFAREGLKISGRYRIGKARRKNTIAAFWGEKESKSWGIDRKFGKGRSAGKLCVAGHGKRGKIQKCMINPKKTQTQERARMRV